MTKDPQTEILRTVRESLCLRRLCAMPSTVPTSRGCGGDCGEPRPLKASAFRVLSQPDWQAQPKVFEALLANAAVHMSIARDRIIETVIWKRWCTLDGWNSLL